MTGQLDLSVTGIELDRFVKFTPRTGLQHRRWVVLGEPAPRAKGYARFNGRSGDMLGSVTLTHGGDYSVVLQFDDGSVESFDPMALAPDLAEASHG